MISILIPSYGRADRAAEVAANIIANTTYSHEIIFIVEEDQYNPYLDALSDIGDAKIYPNKRSKNYAGAINTGAFNITGHHIFMGADDLSFHPQWDDEALRVMASLDSIKVVGTNDLFNTYVLQGWHATHYLVDRDYIWNTGGVIDGRRGDILHEGYDHNYTDTEFIGTAKARAVFAPCLTSVVEHIGWTTNQFQDETKAKTNRLFGQDTELYESRKHLWENLTR